MYQRCLYCNEGDVGLMKLFPRSLRSGAARDQLLFPGAVVKHSRQSKHPVESLIYELGKGGFMCVPPRNVHNIHSYVS